MSIKLSFCPTSWPTFPTSLPQKPEFRCMHRKSPYTLFAALLYHLTVSFFRLRSTNPTTTGQTENKQLGAATISPSCLAASIALKAGCHAVSCVVHATKVHCAAPVCIVSSVNPNLTLTLTCISIVQFCLSVLCLNWWDDDKLCNSMIMENQAER